MEVCGTHTAAIYKYGIRSLLSPNIKLISGPGCPVCVTMSDYIDQCIEISQLPGHELICFGDLMKIPGSKRTLSDAKAAGGRIRMVWSPFDAIALSLEAPETTFVATAIGFETTAPAFGLLIDEAEMRGVRNLKLITSLKSALAAIDWICSTGEAVDAFLCPGHVSVVTGADAYLPLAEKYSKPFIIAGFEGRHLITAIRAAAEDAYEGRFGVRNLYPEAVSAQGNKKARLVTEKYFALGDAVWRGLGNVSGSGYFLRDQARLFFEGVARAPGEQDKQEGGETSCCRSGSDRDHGIQEGSTSVSFGVQVKQREDFSANQGNPDGCRCGDVILGRIDPDECPLFGYVCTPSHAIGPCMVSSEGACGYRYWERPTFQ